jgi:hypothetical protein
MASQIADRCARCGRDLGDGDAFALTGGDPGERASFCRLEHVVAWVLRGATWDPAGSVARRPAELPERCSQCDASAPALVLVHHRLGSEVIDGFCSIEHLRAWCSAGGRWRS